MEQNSKIILQEQYDALRPYPKGASAPRVGAYKILSTEIRDYGDLKVPIAKTLWSPTIDGVEDGLPVEIQLFSLDQKHSQGPIGELKKGLAGKVIEVTSTTLSEGGKSANWYGVNWRIPAMLSSNPFYLFGTGTLGDSMAMFSQSLSETDHANVLAIEQEVYHEEVGGEPEFEYDDSGFIEPDYPEDSNDVYLDYDSPIDNNSTAPSKN